MRRRSRNGRRPPVQRDESRIVLLGVCGSSYAAIVPRLIEILEAGDARIEIIATAAARRFLGELRRDFYTEQDWIDEPLHVQLPARADAFLVAPVTANTIGKLANGISDNLLCAAVLASPQPVTFFPAMSRIMWDAASTVRNVTFMREAGMVVREPTPMIGLSGDDAVGFDPAAAARAAQC